jgi:predicted dehydrogenase
MGLVKVKVKIGVIGAGHQGQVHLERYLALQDKVQVISLCDAVQTVVEESSKKYGVENWHTDYMKILDDDIDAVSICAPNKFHEPMAVAAAEAGKHILLEKPIALTLKEADAIINAANKAKVKLMIAFDQLFNPMVQKAYSLLDNGELGKISMGNFDWYANYSQYSRADFGWRSDIKKAGGGALMESGVHKVSILNFLMGEVNSVFAFANKLIMDIDGEDNIKVLTTHRNGAIGSVTCSWTSEFRGPEQEGFSIYGDKGSIIAYGPFHMGTGHLEFSSASIEEYTRTHYWYPPIRSYGQKYDSYQNEISHFIDCVLNDKTPMVTGEDGRTILEISLAAYESVKEKKAISLPLKH